MQYLVFFYISFCKSAFSFVGLLTGQAYTFACLKHFAGLFLHKTPYIDLYHQAVKHLPSHLYGLVSIALSNTCVAQLSYA